MNYILRLHVKRFILARRDPSFVQPGYRFAGRKFSHIIASARLGGIKKLIKKYPQKHISIDRRYFDCVFTAHMTSFCEKKSQQISLQNFIILQKQPPEVFCKKDVLENFCNIHRKTPVLEWLCVSSILDISFRSKIDSREFAPLLIGRFLTELTFLNQMNIFFKNLNHHWKCRDQKENFQTILVIIFWNFTMFQYRSNSPQVKRNVIPSIPNLV